MSKENLYNICIITGKIVSDRTFWSSAEYYKDPMYVPFGYFRNIKEAKAFRRWQIENDIPRWMPMHEAKAAFRKATDTEQE